jgi:hypothetical protein
MLHHWFFPKGVFTNDDYKHIFLLEFNMSFTHNPKDIVYTGRQFADDQMDLDWSRGSVAKHVITLWPTQGVRQRLPRGHTLWGYTPSCCIYICVITAINNCDCLCRLSQSRYHWVYSNSPDGLAGPPLRTQCRRACNKGCSHSDPAMRPCSVVTGATSAACRTTMLAGYLLAVSRLSLAYVPVPVPPGHMAAWSRCLHR